MTDGNDMGDQLDEIRSQMGGVSTFPEQGIDGFMSHFLIVIEFVGGKNAGQLISLDMPSAIQTVTRTSPFIYPGPAAHQTMRVPLPEGCTLPSEISDDDFKVRPERFFVPGKEVVWMQILNLDARMDTQFGPIRIILGETLKREHPDLFEPSLGIAQARGRCGFPARLFFNPVAIVETPWGKFRAVHGTLSYDRITRFPPISAAVSIESAIPMHLIDDVRAVKAGKKKKLEYEARIIALAHPIDVGLQIPGEEAFQAVEHGIAGGHARVTPPQKA